MNCTTFKPATLIEYLQPQATEFQDLRRHARSVTGPEMMDSRWPQTPVLQVQTWILP